MATPAWRRPRCRCTDTSSDANVRRPTCHPLLRLATVLAAGWLTACAHTGLPAVQPRLNALLPADAILVGEQHDARAHQRLEQALVQDLADRGQLAALVLEMAERGTSTANLPPDATAQQVQDVLLWNAAGWPWERYAPAIMAAVRHGVPVLGANLPRAAMRQAMADPALDTHLAGTALARQNEAIRLGHCNLLPAEHALPMLRIQLARDASMAAAVVAARVPGKTVLLIAGGGHVVRDRGVPTYLPPSMRVRTILAVAGMPSADDALASDLVWPTAALAPQDHCAELARQLRP